MRRPKPWSILALPLWLTTFAAQAAAEPAPYVCRTITSRSAQDVIVPFGERAEGLPAQAVKIRPGETLCIGGKVDGTGELRDLVLLEEASAADGPTVSISLARVKNHDDLGISHSAPQCLAYHASAVVTRQNLAVFSDAHRVAPGVTGWNGWGRHAREVLLFGFRFTGAPTSTWPKCEPPPPLEPTSLPNVEERRMNALVAAGVGERYASFPALNRALSRDGFAPLPATEVVAGFDVDVQLWRVRFGLDFSFGGATTANPRTGTELGTSLWMGAFTAGFELLRHGGFTLFSSLGLGAGELGLNGRNPGLTLFAAQLRPWEHSRVVFSHTLLPLELGYDYLVPLVRMSPSEVWALDFGARAQAFFQLGGYWQSGKDEPREIPGPKLDTSGFQYVLSLGLAGYQPGSD